jgi:hypothetical protein
MIFAYSTLHVARVRPRATEYTTKAKKSPRKLPITEHRAYVRADAPKNGNENEKAPEDRKDLRGCESVKNGGQNNAPPLR